MHNPYQAIQKLEQDCVNRYHRDTANIEDRLDSVCKQRNFLKELDEQIHNDGWQTKQRFSAYEYSSDTKLRDFSHNAQNAIDYSLAELEEQLYEKQDELDSTKRKLERDYDKREREYKQELTSINNRTSRQQV